MTSQLVIGVTVCAINDNIEITDNVMVLSNANIKTESFK